MASLRNIESVVLLVVIFEVCRGLGQDPMVTVGQGTLVGKTVTFQENKFINISKQIDLFLGVPFAEPPRRFEPPRPKEPWSDIWNATSFESSCFQNVHPINAPPSEDCLYLNVYAPNPTPTNAAVMVWIHGGSFNDGSAMSYDYYGVPMAAVGDVIVVTINYRVNIFSRFSTGDEAARGNYGMLDQVAALQWVQDNIRAFGGDENKVTIFGESAGAASVNFHMLSPLSKGLFHQAIMQSGNGVAPWSFEQHPENDRQKAERLGDAMGCDDVSDSSLLVECLRTKDANELMTAAARVYGGYQVTLDGVFMEDTPLNLYGKGEFAHVPVLAGFNEDEGTFVVVFSPPTFHGTPNPPPLPRILLNTLVADSVSVYDGDDDILEDAVFQEYVDWTTDDQDAVNYYRPVIDVISDSFFRCPTDVVVRKHVEAGDAVFKYFMTHGPSATSYFEIGEIIPFTPWLDAGHAEDLIFVFGMPFIEQLAGIHGHNLTDAEKAMSVQVMRYWTNFAKSGNPNSPSTVGNFDSWPEYTIPELRHKELSPEFKDGRAALARQCHLWNEHLYALAASTGNLDEDQKEWKESYTSWQNDMILWRTEFEEYQENTPCNE
ncbi:cholinesterase 1 [Strongylocentrotus purpuratus]|uniref:Carboxylic ester hydrolase n=1 Tax=Strongylocentrotus purpuratus TaxID=7668 RepID=A0A7M7T5U7_STRPU|nr:cholinesterase 1 [Strongylocentrotus purpuratus]